MLSPDRRKPAAQAEQGAPNVRAVLSEVELGETDAGLVHKTDAATAATATAKVDAVEIPDAVRDREPNSRVLCSL